MLIPGEVPDPITRRLLMGNAMRQYKKEAGFPPPLFVLRKSQSYL
jgi:hypothetical protein